MLGTKIEITLPKAEPGHWTTLYIPKKETEKESNDKPEIVNDSTNDQTDSDSDLDLDDIEQVRGVRITDA